MKDPEAILTELLRTIIVGICRNGSSPSIRYKKEDGSFDVALEHGDDKGRCIGRKGRIFWAISSVMWHAGQVYGIKARVEPLREAAIPRNEKPDIPFKPKMEWDRERLKDFLEDSLPVLDPQITWSLAENLLASGEIVVVLELPNEIRRRAADPDLGEALGLVIHAVGSACGAAVETRVTWV